MKREKQKLFYSSIFPLLFVLLIWLIKIVEEASGISFHEFGVKPRNTSGLQGIILSPFLHGDWEHLWANTAPILVLGTAIFYFFRPIAFRVIFFIYIISGIWLWFGGREVWHIGASGLIYGFASFVAIIGFLSKERSLGAISLLTVFLYGSIIWGILPLKQGVSWEGHLYGLISGIIIAYYYRNYFKKDEIEEKESDFSKPQTTSNIEINYEYLEDNEG